MVVEYAMSAADPETNPLYSRADQVPARRWEELARRDPEAAAAAAGAVWEGGSFRLPMLRRDLRVDPGGRTVAGADGSTVGFQRALVAVAYLGRALDVPPRGQWVAPRELPGGDAFFRGPHALATPRVAAAFGVDLPGFREAARSLGGQSVDGADAAVEVPALPRIPLRLLLWAASAEFPGSATLLVDARAHLHLALDVVWALTNVTIADVLRGRP